MCSWKTNKEGKPRSRKVGKQSSRQVGKQRNREMQKALLEKKQDMETRRSKEAAQWRSKQAEKQKSREAKKLESRRRRTKGSVVGEEWCQNAAPLRWYTKNVFAQSKMILSRAWLHDTVSCAAWNDARKGVYLKPLFKTPCSNCYWSWSKPIMLDYRDISLMESVPLLWRTVTASPVGIETMTILGPPPFPLIIDI